MVAYIDSTHVLAEPTDKTSLLAYLPASDIYEYGFEVTTLFWWANMCHQSQI